MNTKKLALSAASLTLVLSFLACNVPGSGGGTPTFIISEAGEAGEPGGALVSTPAPGVPTNTDGADTVVIPAGTFWMGSDDSDVMADEDEKPRHQVTLETFPIYTHEVTNAMYARCVAAGACLAIPAPEGGPTSRAEDPEYAEGPVVGVDWNMADNYCTWAGARLPTEAEWEYAARGTESLLYPWGEETPTCDRVNMGGCLTPADTVPVGSFVLGNSPFDVWDMAGNVWEWTHDWYDPDYYALSPSSSPLGPNLPEDPDRPQKVARGGGMNSEPASMRSAARIGGHPLRSYEDVGFRCVAQPALDLPAGYAGVPEGHEWVPPDSLDDGDSIEDEDGDPVWSTWIGAADFTCPGPDGRISLIMMADSSVDPTTFSVSVGGVPFDCSFDPVAVQVNCSGFPPAEYDTWVDRGPIEVCIEHAYASACTPWVAFKPADCPPADAPPPEITATADCPSGGYVTIIFRYELAMRVHEIRILGLDVTEFMWWPLGDNQTIAIVPARAPGESYFVSLSATDEEGRGVDWWRSVPIPAECEPETPTIGVTPLCYEGHQAVQVKYVPTTLVLTEVSTETMVLSCIPMAPGVQVCGDLPGDPGAESGVTLCFEGEPCQEFPVTVPACPGTETVVAYWIEPACLDPTGEHVAVIRYAPADLTMASASADGSARSFQAMGSDPGLYLVRAVLGPPGSEVTITFCLEDGSCFSGPITIRDCGLPDETTEGSFRLAGTGCHDETHISFGVDTGLSWLVPETGFTYHVSDGERNYVCGVHPTIAGRLYCWGDRPGSPGALEVCVDQDGPPPAICDTVADWPAQVSVIPDCAPPPCSSYTSYDACVANLHCRWSQPMGQPKGACVDR